MLPDALAVATAIDDSTDRVEALAALLPRLDGTAHEQALEAAFAALEDASVGEHYLARLVAALAAAAPERLLDVARRSRTPEARAAALTALLPHRGGAERRCVGRRGWRPSGRSSTGMTAPRRSRRSPRT